MVRYGAIMMALGLCFPCLVTAQTTRTIDDSYTISQRYDGYKEHYPGIEWPKLSFKDGQQILFDRRYKKDGDRELRIDIFLPPPQVAHHQALLLVHGGAWRSGSKSHFYALANLLSQRGYVVLIPEYRLAPESGYPTGLIDVNDAIVWAKANAAEFGFDKAHIALGGASSGGQMAALLAYTADTGLYKSNEADDTQVNGLVDLDGVLDFTTPMALQYENAAGPNSVAAKWLGGAWEQAPERWLEASASKHITENAPPTLVISSGQVRFTAGKDEVMTKLGQNHIPFTFFSFTNAPHDVWLFEPYLSQIVDKVDTFLKERH